MKWETHTHTHRAKVSTVVGTLANFVSAHAQIIVHSLNELKFKTRLMMCGVR